MGSMTRRRVKGRLRHYAAWRSTPLTRRRVDTLDHGCWCGISRQQVDARHEDLAATAVADRELRQALRQVPGRTLLFIDTCHAGAVLGATSGRNSELARFVNEMSDNGVVVFAASSGRQESLEHDDWGNGAFTSALLEGLGGKADPFRAGRVTYKGLDYFVSEEVQRLTKGRQTPVSLSPYGVPDFELARL